MKSKEWWAGAKELGDGNVRIITRNCLSPASLDSFLFAQQVGEEV